MSTKTTRHALVMSVISLVLCISMLIGTTFAWFTDSATSARNQIVAGNLDVVLEYWNGSAYDEVDSNDKLFNDAALWEPGHTEVAYLKVSNAGSLALKYKLAVNVYGETLGKTEDGKVIKLSDYIQFKVVESDTDLVGQYATRTDAQNANAAPSKLQTYNSAVKALEPKNAAGDNNYYDYVALILYMPESVANEANHDGINIPSIKMGVTLNATQYNAESDSFGNTYDEAADFINKDKDGNWLISSKADLMYFAQQVNNGKSYQNETIILTDNIDLGGMDWTPIGNGANGFMGTFDGNGMTISNYTVEGKEAVGLFGYALNGGNIKNLTVSGATVKANDYAGAILGRGYTDVVNCHVVNSTVTVTPYLLDNGKYDGGAKAGAVVGQLLEGAGNSLVGCTATNVKVVGYRDIGAVLGMAHSNNTVTDCAAYNSEVSYYYIDASAEYSGNPNENIGEVVGRVSSSATVTGSTFSNVKTDSIYVYGLKLTRVSGDANHYGTITVSDAEGLFNLAKLNADWVALFTDGNGNQYQNYPINNYYYDWIWTIVLENDIDLGGAQINPIDLGKREYFDGQNHTIKNAVIITDANTENEAGLFDASECGVRNLKLDNIQVQGSNVGNSTAGVLSGSVNKSISNVTITNSSVSGGKYTGGITGYGYTDIDKCTLENVTVKGGYKLGGIIGYICATDPDTGNVKGNTLTDCTVDGIGGGVYAGGKSEYIVGKIVGNYNCDGNCVNNTIEGMTTSATNVIGKIEAGQNVINGDGKYVTDAAEFAEMASSASAGETITLLEDVTLGSTVSLPNGVIFNGNGKQINGTLKADGDITLAGHVKVTAFNAGTDNVITISEGACLEVTGKDRATSGYNTTFDIKGEITDAKTLDKSTAKPSMIIPGGLSITGGNGATINIKDAYVKIGNTSSKNSAADGTFVINIDNSVVDFTAQFTFAEPTSGKTPTFKVNIKDSVVTTATKMCFAAPDTTIVIDNSIVTSGTYLRNSGNITLKNGSVLTAATIQFGENGGNNGTITVDNSTLTITTGNNAGHAFDGKGVGKIVAQNGANVSVEQYKNMTIECDTTSTFTGVEVN